MSDTELPRRPTGILIANVTCQARGKGASLIRCYALPLSPLLNPPDMVGSNCLIENKTPGNSRSMRADTLASMSTGPRFFDHRAYDS